MIKRRSLLAVPGAVIVAGALPGCGGGGSSSGGGTVRLVNATGLSSIDLRVSNTNLIAGVAKGAVSGYVSVSEGTSAFQVGENGQTTTVLTQSATVSKDVAYTMVAYTTNSTVNAAFFSDSEATPSSGTAKIRLFNASAEAGSLDFYVTAEGADLAGSTAINATVAGQRVGAYTQYSTGTWRLSVTGAGDPEDIRLQVSGITLADQQIYTFVVTATDSGVLVNGLLAKQGGTVTTYDNAFVRLRVVADVASGGRVVVASGSTTVGALTSPSVGGYKLVPVDLSGLTATVNGTALNVSGLTATAGSDLTLLVHGTAAAPVPVLLVDDNRVPTSTSRSKVRVVHGRNDLPNETLTASVNFGQVGDPVAFAASNKPTTIAVGSDMNIQVLSSSSTTAVYDNSIAPNTLTTLTGQSVYTMFVLGDGTTNVFRLSKDR